MMIQNYRRAVEVFERALALDPGHEPTRRKLDMARERLDNDE
jgi:hypothetical protein